MIYRVCRKADGTRSSGSISPVTLEWVLEGRPGSHVLLSIDSADHAGGFLEFPALSILSISRQICRMPISTQRPDHRTYQIDPSLSLHALFFGVIAGGISLTCRMVEDA